MIRAAALTVILVATSLSCGGKEKSAAPLAVDAAPTAATAAPATVTPTGARLTLERLYADPPLEGKLPRGVTFSPDGRTIAFLHPSEADSEVMDLWSLRLDETPPVARPLVAASDLVDVKAVQLSEEERMALERKRIRTRGITSYRFCGERGDRLLFPLAGDLYLVTLGADAPVVARVTTDGAPKLDARCSPGGRWLSWHQDGDVRAIELGSGVSTKTRALTKGGTATRMHGVAEFVSQEEMGRHDGHWWSHDDGWLAYTDVDLSPVAVKLRPRIFANRTELTEQRYPAAGEPNARVRVRLLDVNRGKDVELPLPAEDGYVARVKWGENGAVHVQWQSRDQRRLQLWTFRPPAFAPTLLLEETDEAWVELHDDFAPLADGRFVWSSERSGLRQLYLVSADGETVTAITGDATPVQELVAVDEAGARLFYMSATEQARQRQLHVVPLAGGASRPITVEPGFHGVSADRKGRAFLDTYSSATQPPTARILDPEGKVLHTFPSEATPEWVATPKPTSEWITVKAEDGTLLNGLVLPPIDRHPGERYPVIVSVYGGPGVQVATEGYRRPFYVYLTQQGYGVFMLDNRGSSGRDRAFARAIHKRLGEVEVADQLRGIAALKELPWVDPDRIGVYGWSYGGTMAALLAMAPGSPVAAAVSGAPVTDWRLYDTHYTERYLGMPGAEAAVYDKASVLGRVAGLAVPMLLVHGTADDNVLFENSLRLVEKLQEASLRFELMIYPGQAHGIAGRERQLHLYRSIMSFFDRTVRARVPAPAGGAG